MSKPPLESAAQLPRFDELMWPTLQVIKGEGGSATVQEINGAVASLLHLTEAQQEIPHKSGAQSEFAYRMAWARDYLKYPKAIENPSRGLWVVTDYGSSLDPHDMPELVRERRKSQRRPRTADGGDQSEVEGEGASVSEELDSDEGWRDRLLSVLKEMKPDQFERLCQRLLREVGFIEVQVTGRSGDGGIDGMGVLRVSLLSSRVFFQCKRYRGSVGSPVVRDFRGAMTGRSDRGLIITTGSFTPDAIREANREGAPLVDLVGGAHLCDLLKEHGLGVQVRRVDVVDVDADWFHSV